jgi:hypothetical protein
VRPVCLHASSQSSTSNVRLFVQSSIFHWLLVRHCCDSHKQHCTLHITMSCYSRKQAAHKASNSCHAASIVQLLQSLLR